MMKLGMMTILFHFYFVSMMRSCHGFCYVLAINSGVQPEWRKCFRGAVRPWLV
jgi:hypothetical protein